MSRKYARRPPAMSTAPLTRRERIFVVVGTAIVCALGAVPIYYRRKDRERGSYETMAEKREAQRSRERAAADAAARQA